MIIPESGCVLERTDKLTGTALCRQELGKKEVEAYSVYGLVAGWITPEVVNSVARNIGALTEQVMSYSNNKKIQSYSNTGGYLASEGTKVGLELIKYLASNADRAFPIKGIIKLMRYCTEEEMGSFIQDVAVSEIIAALPIRNDIGYKIFINSRIDSPDEVMAINYSKKELEHIGLLLYFMVRAKCSVEEIKYKRRLYQSLCVMGVENRMKDYEAKYRDGAKSRATQVFEACAGFQNLKQNKLKIDGRYFSRVVKKMSYYVPQDSGIERQSLVIASQGIDAFIDKDADMAINTIGQAVALFSDAHRKSVDDIKQDCHKCLVAQGVEGNLVCNEIMPASDEIRKYYDDLEVK